MKHMPRTLAAVLMLYNNSNEQPNKLIYKQQQSAEYTHVYVCMYVCTPYAIKRVPKRNSRYLMLFKQYSLLPPHIHMHIGCVYMISLVCYYSSAQLVAALHTIKFVISVILCHYSHYSHQPSSSPQCCYSLLALIIVLVSKKLITVVLIFAILANEIKFV